MNLNLQTLHLSIFILVYHYSSLFLELLTLCSRYQRKKLHMLNQRFDRFDGFNGLPACFDGWIQWFPWKVLGWSYENQWIGLKEHWNRTTPYLHIFTRKIDGFRFSDFPKKTNPLIFQGHSVLWWLDSWPVGMRGMLKQQLQGFVLK